MEPVSVETKYGPFRNVTSIATYGAFSEEIDTTFANELDLQAFAQEILSETSRPELRVDRVRFNASNLIGTAANLEIFDLVKVEYTNDAFHIDEAFHVLAIEHTITAEPNTHKWLVDVDLISLGGNE